MSLHLLSWKKSFLNADLGWSGVSLVPAATDFIGVFPPHHKLTEVAGVNTPGTNSAAANKAGTHRPRKENGQTHGDGQPH